MNRYEKIIFRLSFVLCILQVIVILLSWLVTAAMPDLPKHSLLSSMGIRWFFGTFVSNLAQPLLIWFILITFSLSAAIKGGLCHALTLLFRQQTLNMQQRFALTITGLVLAVELLSVGLLTLLPHAILLSITGHLFPSSFSASLVPILAFICGTCSIVYGLIGGTMRTIDDIGHCLCAGGPILMPLLFLYVIGAQFLASIGYVLTAFE